MDIRRRGHQVDIFHKRIGVQLVADHRNTVGLRLPYPLRHHLSVDKTAVNTICLGTYTSCFSFHSSLVKAFLEAGAKVKLVFLTDKKILKFFLRNITTS